MSKNNDCDDRCDNGKYHFEAERVAHSLVVAASEELSTEYGRARDSAEYSEVENENKLIGNGNGTHVQCSQSADH